jgi:hypothetical protein
LRRKAHEKLLWNKIGLPAFCQEFIPGPFGLFTERPDDERMKLLSGMMETHDLMVAFGG